MVQICVYLTAVWNIAVMLMYGWDKLCARKGRRRIRESQLLTAALILGSVGAMFGMVLFSHKTSKMKFRLLVPFFVLLHAALTYVICINF